MRLKDPLSLAAIAAVLILAVAFVSCLPSRVEEQPSAYTSPITAEVNGVNLAAYPEISHTVKSGDTVKSVAASYNVDPAVLALANGIQESTVLQPGYLVNVPVIRPRGEMPAASATVPASPGRPPAATGRSVDAPSASGQIVDRHGNVLALYTGTVAEVYRGYTTLGDVVVIEGDMEKTIYSGTFAPTVAKGDVVAAGGKIGSGAQKGGVTAARFPK